MTLSAGDVTAIYELARDEAREVALRQNSLRMRELIAMKHNVDIPKTYQGITKAVRTPYVRDAWLRIAASMTAKPPIVNVAPVNPRNEESKRAANLAERWDEAAILLLNGEWGFDAVYESVKALVRDGESVLKVVHRPDAYANFPVRDEGESAGESLDKQDAWRRKNASKLPFAWRVVDRLQCVFENGEFGDKWAIEYGEYPRNWLMKQYRMVADDNGELVSPQGLSGTPVPEDVGLSGVLGSTRKMEMFTADEWAVVIDGNMAPGFPKDNPYAPYLPYLRARAADSESMLYSLLELVPAMDRLLTMKSNWSYLSAYPIPLFQTTPNMIDAPLGDDTGPTTARWVPGKALDLPPGKTFGFAVPPPVGRDIDGMIDILRALIDVAGIPSIFRGIAGADQAGYAINQLMQAASMAFKTASKSLERQIAGAVERLHWMVTEVIEQPVYAAVQDRKVPEKFVALKPDGKLSAFEAPLDQTGAVTVRFRPTLPTDEQARLMVANQMLNSPKPLLPQETILEKYVEVEDPQGEMDRIWVEKAMNEDPAINKAVVQRALQEAGLAEPVSVPPQILGPDGNPIARSGGGMGSIPPGPGEQVPGTPGSVAGGMPVVPGMGMPIQPKPPAGRVMRQGGRPPGMFPGLPGGPNR